MTSKINFIETYTNKQAAKSQEKQAEREFEASENQKDRENKIREAVIKTMGFDEDIQGNQVNDMVQYGELALKEVEADRAHTLAERKQESENENNRKANNLKEKELKLKDKEIDSKEKIEKLKAKTALKNKVPSLEIRLISFGCPRVGNYKFA